MSGVKSKVDNLKSLYNEGLFILLICVIKKKLRSSFSAIDLDYLAVGVNHRFYVHPTDVDRDTVESLYLESSRVQNICSR